MSAMHNILIIEGTRSENLGAARCGAFYSSKIWLFGLQTIYVLIEEILHFWGPKFAVHN